MYCDRTDLAVCGSTHIRAPYAGTGGNDVVHSPLFQVTAGIFPDQAGDDAVSYTHLDVYKRQVFNDAWQ